LVVTDGIADRTPNVRASQLAAARAPRSRDLIVPLLQERVHIDVEFIRLLGKP
jgi:hypothetical protein